MHKARDGAAGSPLATEQTAWVWDNDQPRRIRLPSSLGADDGDQLDSQLRQALETNDVLEINSAWNRPDSLILRLVLRELEVR